MNLKKFLKNLTYLSILKATDILYPLLLFIYLIKAIGSEKLGLIILAQSIITYFQVFINFGLNIPITNQVAVNQGNKKELEKIIINTYIIKGFFLTLSLAILYTLSLVVVFFKDNFLLLLAMTHIMLYEFMIPNWYFQGVEKVKPIAFLNIGNKLLSITTIFFLIKSEGDYLLVPIINFIFSFLFGSISIIILCKEIKFIKKKNIQNTSILFKTIKENFHYFISRLAIVMSEKGNIIIIGWIIGLNEVTYYDLMQKIINLGKTPFSLLNQAIYPVISKSKDMILAKKATLISVIMAIIVYLVITYNANHIFSLLIPNPPPTYIIESLYILALTVITSAISFQLGNCILVIQGYKREFNNSVLYQLAINYIIISSLAFFGKLDIFSMSVSLLFSSLFEVSYRYTYSQPFLKIKRKK